MRKSLKIFLVLLFVLIFSVTAALALVFLTFDDDDYRRGLVSLVNTLTDYRIEIEDPFTLRLSQEPALAAAAVRVLLPGKPEELIFHKVDLVLTPAALLQGQIQLEVAGLVADPASLKWLLPRELYALNSVSLAGQVTATDSELSIREFKAWGSNPQGVKIDVAGAGLINDFSAPQPFSELDLLINVVSPDSCSLKGYLPDDLPELGPVHGSLRLVAVSDSELAVEEIDLDFGMPDKLSLKAEGRIAKIPVAPGTINTGIDLKLTVQAPQTEDIGRLLDQPLPEVGALAITGRVQGSGKEFQVEKFKLSFGRTVIGADLKVSFAGKVPEVDGQIAVQTLYLDDFLPQLVASQTTEAKDSVENSNSTENPDGKNLHDEPLFSQQPFPLLDWLHDLDCDIDITIDRVIGFQKMLRNFELGVKIKNDTLSIDPVVFVFDGGYVKASLLMDDIEAVPEIALKCAVDDLDLVDALSSFDLSSPVTGKLTVNADLHSRGISAHELVTNLNGRFEVALEEGRVPSHTLNLVAVDMLGWSFRRALMKQKYADINCGILGLQVDKGVLECRTFILEAPSLRITGAGTVDLTTETCDLTLYPKKKKKFWATVTPVTIKGPLRNPTVRAIPVKMVAILYGGSLLAPQFFLPAIGLNYLWEMVSKDKNGVQSPCFEHLLQQSQ